MLKKLLVAIKFQDEYEAHKDNKWIFTDIFKTEGDEKYYFLAFSLDWQWQLDETIYDILKCKHKSFHLEKSLPGLYILPSD